MERFTVDFYRGKDGTKPVGQFIRSLPVQMKAKVIGDLHLLEEYGNLAREPLSKHLEDGIFELRSKMGTDRACKKTQKGSFFKKGVAVMSDLQELTNELMADDEFRREYEAIQPELDITRAIMDARIKAGITQMQLSERSGISQADISRLENGNRNPSLNLLKRLAKAMNMTLRIEFVPNVTTK